MQKLRSDQYAVNLSNFYAGGLSAVDLVFLQAFLSLSTLNPLQVVSVIAFSIALPLLAGMLTVNMIEHYYPYRRLKSRAVHFIQALFVVGIIADIIGVDTALWSITWIVGAVFIGAFVTSIIVYGIYVSDLHGEDD
jgi:hypothetical protein